MTQMTQAIEQHPQAVIDLQRFCARSIAFNTRYAMDQPFVRGGWRYATDGRILLRIPAPLEANTPNAEGQMFPDCEAVIRMTIPGVGIDAVEWPTTGMVREVAACPQCDGRGEIKCYECGSMITECLMCDGEKRFDQDVRFVLGDHNIDPKYANLLASLPGFRVWPGVKPFTAIPFIFSGGEGRVLGMKEA